MVSNTIDYEQRQRIIKESKNQRVIKESINCCKDLDQFRWFVQIELRGCWGCQGT